MELKRPIRIQRKRTKGWRMPENTVYVGRGSAYGNQFIIGKDGTAEECIEKYQNKFLPYTHTPPNNSMDFFLMSEAWITDVETHLKGKNLACWCALSSPCHGDFLLSIANQKENLNVHESL